MVAGNHLKAKFYLSKSFLRAFFAYINYRKLNQAKKAGSLERLHPILISDTTYESKKLAKPLLVY